NESSKNLSHRIKRPAIPLSGSKGQALRVFEKNLHASASGSIFSQKTLIAAAAWLLGAYLFLFSCFAQNLSRYYLPKTQSKAIERIKRHILKGNNFS
ncbi:MAG: hypothetical protein LBH92_08880, partial [Bacteroidales bacterium]|nr:hypothetical protein [Bacteroidales bacterium]